MKFSADPAVRLWMSTVTGEEDESSRVTVAGMLSTRIDESERADDEDTDDPLDTLGTYFHLTAAGQRRLRQPGMLRMSPYLRDLIDLCRDGAAMDHLRQWMPPASLYRSLQTLIDEGLVESLDERLDLRRAA